MSTKSVCVCIGRFCGPVGGDEVLKNVALAQKQKNAYYEITTTRCLGHCSHAPNMTVDNTIHKNVDPNKAKSIIRDDNPKDLDVLSKDKTDPNAEMRADEIIEANNFLGDL